MNASSEQLGQNVQPLIRDYVRAYVAEELARERAVVRQTMETASLVLAEATALRDEARARIDKLDEKLRKDPAYEITKMKIIRLMKELNLE